MAYYDDYNDSSDPTNDEEKERINEEYYEKYCTYMSNGKTLLDMGSREHSIPTLQNALFNFGQAARYALDEHDDEVCKEYIKECSELIDYFKSDEYQP